ncbi:hypothetical protein [Glutamicibacter sp. X7]
MLKSVAAISLSFSALAGVAMPAATPSVETEAMEQISVSSTHVAGEVADPAFRNIWCGLFNNC